MVKILVVGDSIIDHYIFGRINRQSPEDSSIPVLDVDSEEYRLGGCLNVAANLKSLSKENIYVTSIVSSRCVTMLKSREIECGYCYRLTNLDGIKKTRIVDLKSQKQIVRLDNVKKFDEQFLEEFKFLVKCVDFNEFDCLVVSDYCKGTIDDFMIRKIQTCKKPVFVDTKNSDLSIWNNLKNCIVKVNLQEFTNKTNIYNGKLIVTLSEKGCQLYDREKKIKYFSTTPIKDGDVTGAGDVHLSGLVTEYIKSNNINKAIEFANKAAGKSVEQYGTVEVYI